MLVLEQGLESKEGQWGELGRAEGRWGGWEAHSSYQKMRRPDGQRRKCRKKGTEERKYKLGPEYRGFDVGPSSIWARKSV